MDLPAELVLRQAEIGVIVADRQGNVLFANEHVAALLRLPSDASKIAGQPLHALGFIPDGEPGEADEISRQVLSGYHGKARSPGPASDGTLVFLRELAVPLRDPSGDDRRHRAHRHRGRPPGRPARAGPGAAA